MLKLFNSRRRLVVATIILLAGGVVFEHWQRAGTLRHHYPLVNLTRPAVNPLAELATTNMNFEASVDLWANPGVPVYDTDISYANYAFQSALHQEDLTQLAQSPDDGGNFTLPVTMSGQNIDYANFSVGNFKANLTLTPTKARPEDLFPTQLKPGLSGSFNF